MDQNLTWQELIREGVARYYAQPAVARTIEASHVRETPDRLVKVMEYNVSGCTENPAFVLAKSFAVGNYDEMVCVRDIQICSVCAHHGERILGKACFAYVPDKHIVGLSKIPRLVDILCRRPQVQESLSTQIVDIFMRTVEPHGCAVQLRCYHLCMSARGIQEPMAVTETTALRGCFNFNPTRQEFLAVLAHQGAIFP